jgi:hypothetical protein
MNTIPAMVEQLGRTPRPRTRNNSSRWEEQAFTESCSQALRKAGFTVDTVHQFFPDARVMVDVIATNRHAISFYIACRGVNTCQDVLPRSRATFVYKAAMTQAHALCAHGWGPLLLLTSYPPDTRQARTVLAQIDPQVLFDVVNPLTGARRLRWLANADERKLRADLERRRKLFLAGDSATNSTNFTM